MFDGFEKECELACTMAREAGQMLWSAFWQRQTVHTKDDGTPLTATDEAINEYVIATVRQIYPHHGVFGEEASHGVQADWLWVVDPIDGTIPFVNGLPIATISLALVHEGNPVLGVIFDPFLQRLYQAIRGKGAYCNGEPLRLGGAVGRGIDVEWWPDSQYDLNEVRTRIAHSHEVPAFWYQLNSVARAACMVATGDLGACLFAGGLGKAVDIAAAKVIVEEAGGVVTDLFGCPQRYDEDLRGALLCHPAVFGSLQRHLMDVLAPASSALG
jgi:myo-inositol-1(or 4)-monophosphatase